MRAPTTLRWYLQPPLKRASISSDGPSWSAPDAAVRARLSVDGDTPWGYIEPTLRGSEIG